jgi:predicted HicB family RNase H-like nuclease
MTLSADDGTTVQLATRIPKSLHRAIRLDATASDTTLTEWVSAALEAHLERCKAATPVKRAGTPTK